MKADGVAREIDDEIAVFRRFNRLYTRILGLLDERLIQSNYSLTEARVLFELAKHGEGGATGIAEELRLDAGYLSRILRKFEDPGLLARSPSPEDARHSVLKLTRKGAAAFADLDRRSMEQARSLLEGLSPARRSTLIGSMRKIEGVLGPDAESHAPFILRPHRTGDMGWVVQRHGVLYAQEYGWDEQFEALVSKIVSEFLVNFDVRRERCWIADRDGEPLGCIFLVRHLERDDTAKTEAPACGTRRPRPGSGQGPGGRVRAVCPVGRLQEGDALDAEHPGRRASHLRAGRVSAGG